MVAVDFGLHKFRREESALSRQLVQPGQRGDPVWRHALQSRQSPHSLFLTGAGSLIAVSLLCNLLFFPEQYSVPILLFLIACSIFFTAVAFGLGRDLPWWVGRLAAGCVVLFNVFFLSSFGSVQSSLSSMQEFPLIAFYFSWFVWPKTGRILIWVVAALYAVVMASNPTFSHEGALGEVSALQSLILMLMCYELGAGLRKRTVRNITTDPLTRAQNREGFMGQLGVQLTKTLRTGTPMCLVVIDFDDFKKLNDSQGHAAGDQALIETVAYWKSHLRSKDILGRTGGDEFAIILSRTDELSAQSIVSRLRSDSPIAWSWGISQARAGDTVETLFLRGDNDLYVHKRRRHASAS